MRSSFRQIWSRFARTILARASQGRRRKRPGLRARVATEVLETRQLLSSRVADVLKDLQVAEPTKPVPPHNAVLLTSRREQAEDALQAYAKMGFNRPEFLDLKV